MVNRSTGQIRDWLLFANAVVWTIVMNQLSGLFFFRIDLTEEKRFTMKPQTERLLKNLDDQVVVEVLLEGELNPGFSRFQKSIRETLEEFEVASEGKVQYLFTNPLQAQSEKSRNEFMAALVDKGLKPLNIIEDRDGRRSEKIVFPGALVSYAGLEVPVNLLKNSSSQLGAQSALNQSIETIEYELAAAISRMTNPVTKKIAWIKGHGELDSLPVAGIQQAILEQFDLVKVDLTQVATLTDFDLALIVRPTKSWSTEEVYKLDQFIMNGGKVMFFLDNQQMDMNQISEGEDYGKPVEHGLNELLFKYGVRLNPDLIQDMVAVPVPVVTGEAGGRSQITPIPWPFHPMANTYAEHPATRNLDATVFRFVSSMDTVRSKGILKTPLVWSSPYTRTLQLPVRVSIADLRNQIDPSLFNQGKLPLAWMLEGKFQSLFTNRIPPSIPGALPKRDEGDFSRLVLFSDADFVVSSVDSKTGQPYPPGYDPFTRQTFANQELVMNLISFLIEEDGIINARSRKVTIRLLDKEKIRNERTFLQWVNLGFPVVFMILLGLILRWSRMNRYAKF